MATDIAARDLDIEELSYVFNYNLSEVPETYIHRIGRTGRAGRGGTAISFCDYGEMPMLKDIEKLLKKPIPRRAHDYPMEVFEVPVKDAKGRVVNPEDAEARQAAREKHAAQRKQAAEKAAEKAAQPLDAPADPAPGRKRRRGKGQGQAAAPQPPAQPPEKGEKARRTFPHGKPESGESGGLPGRPACGGGRGVLFPPGPPRGGGHHGRHRPAPGGQTGVPIL
ncbi:MAG: helicase-related protein [Evtepia gabavorous]